MLTVNKCNNRNLLAKCMPGPACRLARKPTEAVGPSGQGRQQRPLHRAQASVERTASDQRQRLEHPEQPTGGLAASRSVQLWRSSSLPTHQPLALARKSMCSTSGASIQNSGPSLAKRVTKTRLNALPGLLLDGGKAHSAQAPVAKRAARCCNSA